MRVSPLLLILPLLFAFASCEEEEPVLVCPPGTTMNDLGHCDLPAEDLIRLDEPPPKGCEEPPPEPMPLDTCTSIFDGDPHFETEAQMAEFCTQYDCVHGGVTIGGTEELDDIQQNTEITTLDPLSCLKNSRFLLITQTTNLTHVSLPNYVQSDGGMNVIINEGVESVDLPALKIIGGDLSLQLNDNINAVSMDALEYVGEFFLIRGNPNLPSSEAWALRDQLCPDAVGGATTIAGNGPN
jgi:hypothetical protein